MYKKLILIALLLLFQIKFLFPVTAVIQDIEYMLKFPEKEQDILIAKLVIDNIIDPSIDIKKYSKKVDGLVKTIKSYSGGHPINFNEIQTFLYEKGEWNNNKPYVFDYSDPLGKNIKNGLLTNLIDTKKGNSVPLTILYYILARKFNVAIYMTYAPRHLFLKLQDTKGKMWNIDPSKEGQSFEDSWYIDNLSISKKALQNKIYLQPLTNKEIFALLTARLVPYYLQKKDFDNALYACDLSLKYFPKNVDAMADKGAIYRLMYELELKNTDKDIVIESEKVYLDFLDSQSKKYFKMAEDLGWTPEPKEDIQQYL